MQRHSLSRRQSRMFWQTPIEEFLLAAVASIYSEIWTCERKIKKGVPVLRSSAFLVHLFWFIRRWLMRFLFFAHVDLSVNE